MIDALIYTPSFQAFVTHLDTERPEMLERDEEGVVVQPPVVIGMARTPAAMTGDELMAYCRFTLEQADEWRGMPDVQILGEAEFTGPGTADRVYQQVFDDPEKKAIYDRVYPHAPYTITDPEMGEMTIAPPVKFGVMAGA